MAEEKQASFSPAAKLALARTAMRLGEKCKDSGLQQAAAMLEAQAIQELSQPPGRNPPQAGNDGHADQ